MVHDAGGALAAQHAVVHRMVRIAVDVADSPILQVDADAAAAGAHVAGGFRHRVGDGPRGVNGFNRTRETACPGWSWCRQVLTPPPTDMLPVAGPRPPPGVPFCGPRASRWATASSCAGGEKISSPPLLVQEQIVVSSSLNSSPCRAGTVGPPRLAGVGYASLARRAADMRSVRMTMTKVTSSSSDTVAVLEQVHRGQQFEAEAAGADEAEHQRRADVLVQPIQRDAQQRRQDAWHDGVAEHLQAAGAGQSSAPRPGPCPCPRSPRRTAGRACRWNAPTPPARRGTVPARRR